MSCVLLRTACEADLRITVKAEQDSPYHTSFKIPGIAYTKYHIVLQKRHKPDLAQLSLAAPLSSAGQRSASFSTYFIPGTTRSTKYHKRITRKAHPTQSAAAVHSGFVFLELLTLASCLFVLRKKYFATRCSVPFFLVSTLAYRAVTAGGYTRSAL